MWHSCSNYPLSYHFDGKDPTVRKIFDCFIELIESCGPVEVIPQKTRIAIQAQVRFAGCRVRKKWLVANLWLARKANHPKLQRVEKIRQASVNKTGHRLSKSASGRQLLPTIDASPVAHKCANGSYVIDRNVSRLNLYLTIIRT
jgi:hypothetical protein